MKMQRAIFQHHLQQRVKPNDNVLDAGCGPGTFARDLIEIGAKVTCLDLSKVQLDACRQQVPGCEAYVQGSVTDLGQFATDSFDVALAYGGVLSYCFDQFPTALSELIRVTRPGGRVGLSVMNLLGTIHTFLPAVLTIPVSTNQEILKSGDLTRTVNEGHECHMFRVSELSQLLTDSGLEAIELHASGWLIYGNDVEIPEPHTDAWRYLFEAELEASRESPGAGTHIIAWGVVR